MTRLGCGIVGCGGAAEDMCRAIDGLPGTFVAAAHDRVAERAAHVAATRGGAVHESLEALLADPAVDAVYVALPHHLLAAAAERALLAGKHVLVEKPVALGAAEARSLGRLAAERALVLVPVFELRMAGAFREARRLVSGGALGEVTMVRIRTLIDKQPSYWRAGYRGVVVDGWRARRAEAGGGVVLMNSIHQLDLVRHITGLSFVRAAGEVATLHAGVEVEDTAVAALRLSNGALVALAAAAHSAGAAGDERIELDGTLGRLELGDPGGPAATRLRLFLRRPWGELAAGRWLELSAAPSDLHLELLRAFLAAVAGEEPPPASAEDAAAAVATVLALYESAATGSAVAVDGG